MSCTDETIVRPVMAEELIGRVLAFLQAGNNEGVGTLIADLPEGEVALILESLPKTSRHAVWNLIPDEHRGNILEWLTEQARVGLLETIPEDEAVAVVSMMDIPVLAEVIDTVSDSLGDAILEFLPESERNRVEATLAYPEDSVGRLMETEWVAVRADVTLDVVLRYLRLRGHLPPYTDGLMVVDREGYYQGKLPLENLLLSVPELTVAESMDRETEFVMFDTPQSQIATLFERRDLVSVAVVDAERRLIGRVVIDSVLDLIRTESEHPLMQMAGLNEGEDLFAPIIPSAQRRMIWLGLNLATAFLASWVIAMFEATLERIVVLAVLMPIVASMGGIAGSQTLTLTIRGLAMGHITDANTRWLAGKEIIIGIINGMSWAMVVGVIAWMWFDQAGIALILGLAMVISLLAAAASGLVVPLILERFGIDPALSGSVILTTITDVVGFVSFLGLATWFLL